MNIDTSLKIITHRGVYAPAEDTYFLIKCITTETHETALDMGTGTGIIALHMARQGAQVTAVDKMPAAVTNTWENAHLNTEHLHVIKSDLFENVPGQYDVITFNPPYLPSGFPRDVAWDGGRDGMAVTGRFLTSAHHHLTPRGRIYLLVSTLGDTTKLLTQFQDQYKFRVIDILSLFFEKLVAYEITH